jgi:hypothetical protein
MIKQLLRENLVKHQIYENLAVYSQYNEGQEDFPDVEANCLIPSKIVEWLNDELNRVVTNKTAKKKDKTMKQQAKAGTKDVADAIFTQQNIRSVQDVDIEKYIANLAEFISIEPETIMDANPKMIKSDVGGKQVTVNTGLPAIVGIIYDKQDGHFKSISSCPGAGKCVIGCYARKAFYSFDEDKTIKLARRLNLLWNDPDRYTQRILEELRPTAEKVKMSSIGYKEKMKLVIRWNDAGDFFSKRYVQVAVDVTRTLLEEGFNVMSYAYTKSGAYAIELNSNRDFVINFSTDAHSREVEKVDTYDTERQMKRATKVPKEVWKSFFIPKGSSWVKNINGLPQFRDEESFDALKDAIYYKFGESDKISRDSLVYTFELPTKQDEEENKYNVIVLQTGDSDISAQRRDVKMSYLLAH